MILIEVNVPSTFISFEAQRRTQARPLALIAMVVSLILTGCSSPQKSCYDMYAECQNINGKCTRGYGCGSFGTVEISTT
jgi:hypothetical protein